MCLKSPTSNRKIRVPMNALLRIHEEEMLPEGVSLTMVSTYFGQIGFLAFALNKMLFGGGKLWQNANVQLVLICILLNEDEYLGGIKKQ